MAEEYWKVNAKIWWFVTPWLTFKDHLYLKGEILFALRSRTWVCGCSLARIMGSNPTVIMDVSLLLVKVKLKETPLQA